MKIKRKILILSIIIILIVVGIFFITQDINVENINNESQNNEFYEADESELEELLLYNEEYFSQLIEISELINTHFDSTMNKATEALPEKFPESKQNELDTLQSMFDEVMSKKIVIPEKPSDDLALLDKVERYDEVLGKLQNNLLNFDDQLFYQLEVSKSETYIKTNYFERYTNSAVETYFNRICEEQLRKVIKIGNSYSNQLTYSEAEKRLTNTRFKYIDENGADAHTIIAYIDFIDDTHYVLKGGYKDYGGEHLNSEVETGTWSVGYNPYASTLVVSFDPDAVSDNPSGSDPMSYEMYLSDDYDELDNGHQLYKKQ